MLWQALDPKSHAFSSRNESSQEKREREQDVSEKTGREINANIQMRVKGGWKQKEAQALVAFHSQSRRATHSREGPMGRSDPVSVPE